MTFEEAAIIIGNIPVDGTDECYTVSEYQEAKRLAVEALGRCLSESTKWIPVTEKLPECEDEEVLVQCNGKDGSIRLIDAFVLATYDKDFGWYSMGRPDLEATVTAWMPLPEMYRPDEKEKITTAADWKGHYMGRFEKVN